MRQIKVIFNFLLILILGFMNRFAFATDPVVKPFPPFHIAGNLYYVGNDYVASYLVVTPKGNILINSNFKADVPMLKDSIEKLGFKFSDIKILLLSQAHSDHDAGSALVKAQTGADYRVMDADVSVVESGGKADFRYGNDPEQLYEATKVDHVLHDGDEVKIGGSVLVAHLTPGHTKGCTTWTMKVTEKGKSYNVVIIGGTNVNPGYKLFHNTAYPNIAKDFAHTWRVLKSLPCDIFLGAHGGYFGLNEKYPRMKEGEANPFIDPKGYQEYITSKEPEFQAELAKQRAAESSGRYTSMVQN